MLLRFLTRLLRRGAKTSDSNPSVQPTPPPLKAWLLADIPEFGSHSPVTVTREEMNLLDTLTAVVPQLADAKRNAEGSISVPLPQGLDVDTLTRQLKHAHAFEWKREGETVEKDEFHAHNLHYKPTLYGAWKTVGATASLSAPSKLK